MNISTELKKHVSGELSMYNNNNIINIVRKRLTNKANEKIKLMAFNVNAARKHPLVSEVTYGVTSYHDDDVEYSTTRIKVKVELDEFRTIYNIECTANVCDELCKYMSDRFGRDGFILSNEIVSLNSKDEEKRQMIIDLLSRFEKTQEQQPSTTPRTFGAFHYLK